MHLWNLSPLTHTEKTHMYEHKNNLFTLCQVLAPISKQEDTLKCLQNSMIMVLDLEIFPRSNMFICNICQISLRNKHFF